MRTAKNPGKIRFFRSMRTAKNPSKIFSSGPCGQLKTLPKYFRRGRCHRRRHHGRRCRRRRRRRNFLVFVTLILHGGVSLCLSRYPDPALCSLHNLLAPTCSKSTTTGK